MQLNPTEAKLNKQWNEAALMERRRLRLQSESLVIKPSAFGYSTFEESLFLLFYVAVAAALS